MLNKSCKYVRLYNRVIFDEIYVYLWLHRSIKLTALTCRGFVLYGTMQSGS